MKWILLLIVGISCASCTRQHMATVLPTGGVGTSAGPGVDLPCEVADVLSAHCWSCHGSTPAGDAPMSLASYSDLLAPSLSDPTVTMAEEALLRVQDAAMPMPPPPDVLLTNDEIAALQAWIDAGMHGGSCSIGDPFATAPVCTSGQTWNGGDEESPRMHPGMACIDCHSSGEGPRFRLAGTVFPTGHEPDDCFGAAGVQVVLTGADGQVVTMNANSAGNFYSRSAVALPYTAKLVAGGKERAMSMSQTSGDCNSCHTQNGDNGAPGRILAP